MNAAKNKTKRFGLIFNLVLIPFFISSCEPNAGDWYQCALDENDSEGEFKPSIFGDSLTLYHKKGEMLAAGGPKGLVWNDYFYDEEAFAGIASAGKLQDSRYGYVRFWSPSGKLWINLPPRTLVSYRCTSFTP